MTVRGWNWVAGQSVLSSKDSYEDSWHSWRTDRWPAFLAGQLGSSSVRIPSSAGHLVAGVGPPPQSRDRAHRATIVTPADEKLSLPMGLDVARSRTNILAL